jgi:dephospho-CoA kinase
MGKYRSPTNDLIDQLVSKLTQEGTEILEELERVGDALVREKLSQEEADAAEEAVLGDVDYLPHYDRDILSKVLVLKAQGHEVIEQAHAKAFTDARRFKAMIHRAQELEREEGKEPGSDMTVWEAFEVLRCNGEQP